ncbi:MAG: bifunctional alpha,alpha-trehalose-phosphate synthase (UDP-forming)/trehalose-phosphatase [Armatimonadetes bacterium]|nr:bifunctional alpha,alpha-trehalose-phosphate synthase (UDP-forming)/trehalose-phosphatase [Armatimonadota bacterium]
MPEHRESIEAIQRLLGARQLVVVSNREPYVHKQERQGISVSRPAGGLVAALDPVMQAVSGTWIAWGSGDADFAVADAQGRLRVPPDDPRYALKRLPLSPDEIDGYYYGYANQALWPLFHFITERTRFRRRFWAAYKAVNARFAQAVLDELVREAVVWIHDYHLMLTPRLLRRLRPDLFLMHFWHIPWPKYDVWQICPQRMELLDGLLANDLIGFQRPRHVQAFLECVQRELPAEVDAERSTITYDGHVTYVRAFPISVDFAALDRTARSRDAVRWMARFARRFNLEGRFVAVGVDRLDYTKGIPERLRAFEALLKRAPWFRERLVYIQKSAPSRTRILTYRTLQRKVEREIARLNSAYGTTAWRPIVYLPQSLPLEGIAALYRLADLCVVSSLQDGMNLVAKEFVACRVDERGALVLSSLAGAQRELTGAIAIDPRNVEGFAAALQQALELPEEEEHQRMAQMRAYLAEHDIYHWLEQLFRAAAGLLQERPRVPALHDHVDEIERCLRDRSRLALLLDFDGTLAPIADDPDTVRLPTAVDAALRTLAASQALVVILSGRALSDIRNRVGIDHLVYAGNHGFEAAGPGWAWVHEDAARIAPVVAKAAARMRRTLRRIPGVVVEEKGLTASVHYRRAASPSHEHVRRAVEDEVQSARGVLRLTMGKRVWEIRPNVTWDKGAAARWVLERTYGEGWTAAVCAIYAGDDRTDEDAFRALGGDAITVKVGAPVPVTAARYLARNVDEVAALLARLQTWVSARR